MSPNSGNNSNVISENSLVYLQILHILLLVYLVKVLMGASLKDFNKF